MSMFEIATSGSLDERPVRLACRCNAARPGRTERASAKLDYSPERLNEAELSNIAAGVAWAHRQRRKDILSEDFIRALHRQMLGDVWAWAGKYRTTERNIGVAPGMIQVEFRNALEDARHWIRHGTYSPDEIAVRLHHRLVAIHPYPNGNGRLTRLVADMLAERLGKEPFSWGRANLTTVSETRARYLAALRAADRHDLGPLIEVARS